ncbi:hypothetical protein MMC10_008698 [Thelotrema lepadinum]|nr:hypothetical protein [Thelotrema lepadinum]
MSVSIASRTLIRQSNRQFITRKSPLRWASTTEKASEAASQATSKTKETASSIQSKAAEGLSRVRSSAGPAVTGTITRISNAVRGIGGPVGRLISTVESAIPPTIYYSKVGLELGKMVFNGQRMTPP